MQTLSRRLSSKVRNLHQISSQTQLKSIPIQTIQFKRDFSSDTPVSDVAATATAAAADVIPELGWSMSHIAMRYIENIHLITGVDYWGAIALGTLGLRLMLLPLAIKAQKNAARLQQMKPHIDRITKNMKDAEIPGQAPDPMVQKRFQEEARALFKKYQVNPALAFIVPLAQMPIFISFYFGMTTMGQFFPGMTSGGTQWFTDLTIADPTYALPLVNAALFIGMADVLVLESQMGNKQQAQMMKWFFRALGVGMFPLLYHLPSGLMVYFISQGGIAIVQGVAMQNPAGRKLLGLPKMPKPTIESTIAGTGGSKGPELNITSKITDFVNSQRPKPEHAKAEILDGTGAPPPPPAEPVIQQSGQELKIYANKPTKKKSKK